MKERYIAKGNVHIFPFSRFFSLSIFHSQGFILKIVANHASALNAQSISSRKNFRTDFTRNEVKILIFMVIKGKPKRQHSKHSIGIHMYLKKKIHLNHIKYRIFNIEWIRIHVKSFVTSPHEVYTHTAHTAHTRFHRLNISDEFQLSVIITFYINLSILLIHKCYVYYCFLPFAL